MKVKVTYGVELSTVPELVESMLKTASSSMEKQLNKLKSLECLISEESLINLAPEIIDDIRKEMSTIDLELADAYSILSGYVKVNTNDLVMPSQRRTSRGTPEG